VTKPKVHLSVGGAGTACGILAAATPNPDAVTCRWCRGEAEREPSRAQVAYANGRVFPKDRSTVRSGMRLGRVRVLGELTADGQLKLTVHSAVEDVKTADLGSEFIVTCAIGDL
jgi:hypothetical protein